MDLGIAWTITRKDLGTIRKKKAVLYSTVLLPLMLSIVLPAIIWYVEHRKAIPDSYLVNLLNSFSFFFIVLAGFIPTGIASYSIVGEKVEKSLEPLLATPATDGEILLGKSLASFIPALTVTYVALGIFMSMIDVVTSGQLGYLYYPNSTIAILLLVVDPLVIIFSVGFNVLISSRVSDVRTATQLGALSIVPLGVIYLASEIQLISLDTTALFYISIVLVVADLALFYLSRATFKREEILTKWR